MAEFKGIPSNQTFFSASDIARLLELTPQRVYQLIEEGKIESPAVRVGRSYGFTPEQAFRIQRAHQARKPGDPWSSSTSYRG